MAKSPTGFGLKPDSCHVATLSANLARLVCFFSGDMAEDQEHVLALCCIHFYHCAADVVVHHLTATVSEYALSHCIGINVANVGLKLVSLLSLSVNSLI